MSDALLGQLEGRVASSAETERLAREIRWSLKSGSRESAPQRIYFIQAMGDDFAIKIGRAADAHARLTDMQTGCPIPLELMLATPLLRHAPIVEGAMHRLCIHRIHGEWFAPMVAVPPMFGAMDLFHICRQNCLWQELGEVA
ncbi:MAG TPA: GIY-YIG nuclease family protein [Polyangiaceae bacterium]|nr:GIY-YIG nuclease family protein [Polyangiaceae bacterium]